MKPVSSDDYAALVASLMQQKFDLIEALRDLLKMHCVPVEGSPMYRDHTGAMARARATLAKVEDNE